VKKALAFAVGLWLCLVQTAFADARLAVLVDVLKLDDAVAILSAEGLDHAAELNDEMLEGQGGAAWQQQVAAIYDPNRMFETVRSALADGISASEREQVVAFFADDLGSRIIDLENAAREAIMSAEAEQAARDRYAEMNAQGDPRLDLITAYIEAGDMISRNVASALNAQILFMRGLSDGGAFEMTEDQILSEVTADVEKVSADTTEWLYGYLLLAYHPLSDAELEQYIAFAETPAGEALNSALFDGFGRAYEDISYALGRTVALNMTAKEL
jgi:hypothetical protein